MRTPYRLRILALLGLLVLLIVGMGDLEHQFIFFPSADIETDPSRFGLAYQDVWLTAEDGVRLQAWFVPGDPEKPAVLFFHGNAGNISHRVDNLKLFHDELGTPVLILSYRGYGRSEGRASEQGLYRDARTARKWLADQGFAARRQIYFGRSIGAAVALQLALEQPPAGVVLESPFTSIAAMGRHHYPLLNLALGWLVNARFANLEKIAQLSSPLLMIHGRRDAIVPPAMAERLFARAPEPKRLLWLEQAGHNDTPFADPDAYWQAWRDFLGELPAADTL